MIILTKDRRKRVLSVGMTATASLYMLVAFVAEPMRSLAATSANTVVTFEVLGALSLTCDAASTTGSAAGNGTTGTGALATAKCVPIANNALGYTLSWKIATGSGKVTPACTACFGTGHLLSNNVTNGVPDVIQAIPRKGSHSGKVMDMNTTVIPSGSGARWGARMRGNSTTVGGGAIVWGADGATEGFLNVATGSSVNIAKRTTATAAGGDIQNFLFKVLIPSGTFQPTGTYKATIVFTVFDN